MNYKHFAGDEKPKEGNFYESTDGEKYTAPPPYEEFHTPDNSIASTETGDDGRISLDSKLARRLSKVLRIPPKQLPASDLAPIPERRSWSVKLNIVIQVVGSRGDVQPFIALGNELQTYGHRVRLATHPIFSSFVRESGLEFYSIGGDPTQLMGYMVKNPGLIPSMKTLKDGEIQRKRIMVAEMLNGCWESCIKADEETGAPFVADAIIANPPSFAHVHCAQALRIPVHIMFTMPWTSTRAFPHPLANLGYATKDPGFDNFLSYNIVEWMTWQGLGDLINKFRDCLELEPVPLMEGPCFVETLKIPHTYCWSPGLVPRPEDWPSHIDVCGFFFREPPGYEPPPDLNHFISRSGPPIVYIGFGSIVIDDPAKMTKLILDAVHSTGMRAIISRGWSKLGGDNPNTNQIFYLGDCPHEWLFQHVAAVIHHGGAGTTACGLLNGKPTMIIPFFGDQPFWGKMVAAAGSGPLPINHKSLNAQNLAEGIKFCLTEEAVYAAKAVANRMRADDGVAAAARSFHSNLPLAAMPCELFPEQPAAWRYKGRNCEVRLCKLAAEILIRRGHIDASKLKLAKIKSTAIEHQRWDPATAMLSSWAGTNVYAYKAAAGIVIDPIMELTRGEPLKIPYPNERRARPSNFAMEPRLLNTRINSSIHSADSASERNTVERMAIASGKNVSNIITGYTRGILVDIPLALTEGMQAVPKLYGEEVRQHAEVEGVKSGAMVAGKGFVMGLADGLTDLIMQPVKGGKDEGMAGVGKGIGKGLLGMTTKVAAGAVGLVAFSGQGIVKSLSKAVNTKTTQSVSEAKRSEGAWLVSMYGDEKMQNAVMVETFERLYRQ